jgi:hypothetical protein
MKKGCLKARLCAVGDERDLGSFVGKRRATWR